MEIEKLITSNGTTEQTYDISDPTARQNIINLGSDLNSKISILNNDISKINNLISNVNVLTKCPGTTLIDKLKYGVLNSDIFIIDSNVDMLSQNIVINKPINIIGNGYTLKNTSIEIKTNNVYIESLNIDRNGTDLGDGYNCSTGDFSNIILKNCSVINGTHGFNFQSYNGIVSNILIKNCKVNKCVHGFISKCEEITFENCYAKDIQMFAYGFISDNIPNTRMALCKNNNIINCVAENCFNGFITYARGYYGTTIIPIVTNCQINGLNMINCADGMKIGDLNSGGDITKIEKVSNFNISNIMCTFGANVIYNYQIINCRDIKFSNINNYSYIHVTESDNKTLLSFYENRNDGALIIDILTNTNPILTNNYKKIYIRGGGSTTNKITLTGNYTDQQKIYIFIAGNGGTLTYGGFDTSVFANTNEIPKTANYSDVLCCEFMYSDITSKWLLTNYYKSNYA